MASPLSQQEDSAFVEHARGTLTLLRETHEPPVRALAELRARCDRKLIEGEQARALLRFGPDCLHRVDLGADEALAEFDLGEPSAADLEHAGLRSVLFDMAMGCGQALIEDHDPARDLLVPISYGRVVLRGRLPARFYSHARLRADAEEMHDFVLFDVDILDEAGHEIATVEELMFKRMRDVEVLAPEAAPLAPAEEFEDAAVGISGGAFADELHLGIRPEEGLEAVDLLLRWGLQGHVFVSPRPMGAWLEHLASRAGPLRSGAGRLDPATLAELRQVEATTREIPGVADAAVTAHFDRPGQRRLLAHVVWEPDHAGTVSELRRALRKQLSDDLVPQNFLELDALPRTATGDVELEALEDPFGIADDFVAPRTPTEKTLARIWRQVLGIDRVGLHDNFLDIGGHSVLAMRVLVRLAKELEVRLKNSVMVLQTLEQVAAECDRQLGGPEPEAAIETASTQAAPSQRAGFSGRLLGAMRRGLGKRGRTGGAG
jgi:hypothetical protein